MKPTQTDLILRHLRSGQALTPYQALMDMGCLRLAPRILELRQSGVDIKTHMVKRNGKTFAQYSL